MKKTVILSALLLSVFAATAQSAAYTQSTKTATVDGYTLPRTVIRATVTQEREVIIRGPYARYASQYLGIIGAAQTDKETHTLLGATLSFSEEPDPTQTYMIDEKSSIPTRVFRWLTATTPVLDVVPNDANYADAKLGGQTPFPDMGTTMLSNNNDALSVDRTSSVARTPEQMAADAATTIFKLRKRRIELICADQGENVFGAGLKAALDEIDRLEKEYLALFIGKRFTQTTTKTYSILPESIKNRVVACRFSEAKGYTDAGDLSAAPVNVEFSAAQGEATSDAPMTRKPAGRTIPVRVPLVTQVKLTFNQVVLDSERIPVYQFGNLIFAPVI